RPRSAGLDLIEEEAAPLVPETLDQGRCRRRPPQRLQRERPERVDEDLAEDRPAALADATRVEPEAAVAMDQQREADPAIGPPTPGRVELGRGVEAGLVGLDDPEQAVPLEVAIGEQPLGLRHDPRLLGRRANGGPPGPGEQRWLDRPGLERAGR